MASKAAQLELTDIPDVDVVAWMQSKNEQADALAACLQEAGFQAFGDTLGGVVFDPGVPASQEEALDLAWYVCEGQYPLRPAYAQEWTEEQVGLVYDYWDQYFIPCMEAQGHQIDTSNQPTREAYVAAFHTPERISWWPSQKFAEQSLEVQEALDEVCPAYPPDEAMYGQ